MTNYPLKLGYKASAEQFGPRELLNFAIEAEECGFDFSTRLGRRWLQEGQKTSPSALLFPQLGQIMDRPRPLIPGPHIATLDPVEEIGHGEALPGIS